MPSSVLGMGGPMSPRAAPKGGAKQVRAAARRPPPELSPADEDPQRTTRSIRPTRARPQLCQARLPRGAGQRRAGGRRARGRWEKWERGGGEGASPDPRSDEERAWTWGGSRWPRRGPGSGATAGTGTRGRRASAARRPPSARALRSDDRRTGCRAAHNVALRVPRRPTSLASGLSPPRSGASAPAAGPLDAQRPLVDRCSLPVACRVSSVVFWKFVV